MSDSEFTKEYVELQTMNNEIQMLTDKNNTYYLQQKQNKF